MRTALSKALPALAALALAGCETTQPGPPPIVQIAPSNCSESPSLARAQSLPFDAEDKKKPERVTIDAGSPCIERDGAKSLYRILALPAPGEPYMVTLRSLPGQNSIFAPQLALLDAEGAETRRIDREALLFRGQALSAVLRIRDEERYLVIASDPQLVGQDIARLSGRTHQQMISTGTAMFAVYTGSESTTQMTYSHGGTIDVSATPIQNAR
ncbi:MAG: MalM family protein [Parvibaculum sp.]|uniref:MalM family protein n=1 Tax=Parvibaculum sp. TaxID=2024848 RepID=UPI002720D8F9|nr:MalM family protein [Parvibaculum sp.]MDO8838507.1 MalM family protein [Parvibaculum sp.]